MFLVGIFSTPVPYLLFLLCYGISIAMTNRNVSLDVEKTDAVVLSFEGNKLEYVVAEDAKNFHFSNWKSEHKKANQVAEPAVWQQWPPSHTSPPSYWAAKSIGIKSNVHGLMLPKRAPPIV